MERHDFVQRWSESLERGSASVFIGAGLSMQAGYPSWKTLLKDIAKELDLDIDDEHDLAAVAQYSINRAVGKRNQIAAVIAREFPPKPDAPAAFRTLARLPLRHIWTTNYDTLAETAWRNERKFLNVKSRNDDLGVDPPTAHAILYKMHGTVDHPTDVVIAKDDYELYRLSRPGFLQVLNGHFVGKQILFVGFSFTDPNVAHLFGTIRESFRENGPEHYAIVRRPGLTGKTTKAKARFKTDSVRHRLWVDDLQRYGIRCVEIDEFSEVEAILEEVEKRLARRSVFVSGSFPADDVAVLSSGRKLIEEVATGVGRLTVERKKRLVSGFGLVVGGAVVAGALGVAMMEDLPNFEKTLLLRPFPRQAPSGLDPTTFAAQYRDGMLRQAGISVFIGGMKLGDPAGAGALVAADGVLQEFVAATKLGHAIIPVGATGGASREIWHQVDASFSTFWPDSARDSFLRLNDDSQSGEQLVSAVASLIDSLDVAHTPNRKAVRTSTRKKST